MKIDIKKIAQLARLYLSDEEEQIYEEQLEAILDYFKVLEQVDTKNVEATYQVTGLTGKEREDRVREDGIHALQKELLKSSKYNNGNFLELPPVL